MEQGFTLLGMFGIIDPPRDEALAAVSRCQPAGTLVKMITGDHVVTARAIGVQLGIGNGQAALTGSNLEKRMKPSYKGWSRSLGNNRNLPELNRWTCDRGVPE